jgi:hypothetical protein
MEVLAGCSGSLAAAARAASASASCLAAVLARPLGAPVAKRVMPNSCMSAANRRNSGCRIHMLHTGDSGGGVGGGWGRRRDSGECGEGLDRAGKVQSMHMQRAGGAVVHPPAVTVQNERRAAGMQAPRIPHLMIRLTFSK